MNIPELIDCGISCELRGERSRRSNVGRLTRLRAHRPEHGNDEWEDDVSHGAADLPDSDAN